MCVNLVLCTGNKSQNSDSTPLPFILVSLVEEMTMRLINNPGRDRPIILWCPQTVEEPGRHTLPPVSSHSCLGFEPASYKAERREKMESRHSGVLYAAAESWEARQSRAGGVPA